MQASVAFASLPFDLPFPCRQRDCFGLRCQVAVVRGRLAFFSGLPCRPCNFRQSCRYALEVRKDVSIVIDWKTFVRQVPALVVVTAGTGPAALFLNVLPLTYFQILVPLVP